MCPNHSDRKRKPKPFAASRRKGDKKRLDTCLITSYLTVCNKCLLQTAAITCTHRGLAVCTRYIKSSRRIMCTNTPFFLRYEVLTVVNVKVVVFYEVTWYTGTYVLEERAVSIFKVEELSSSKMLVPATTLP
jgi:hypothetical protein